MTEGVQGIRLAFGGAKRPFLFLSEQWRELQRATQCGPWEIERRLAASVCTEQEIAETIRAGLTGAGMDLGQALDIVEAYVGAKPGDLDYARLTAFQAVAYSLHGLDDDIAGE